MSAQTLGRTNRHFPKVWFRLEVIDRRVASESLESFVEAASAAKTPLDISAAPALFGSMLSSTPDIPLIQVSATDFEEATDAKHAADLIQAHLLQTLSSIGRPTLDFYFLRLRQTLEENQLSGIMEALESARQEDHIRFFGLYAESLGATLGNWQFHDAFDVISVPATFKKEDRDTLKRMAHQRRTGFISRIVSLPSELAPDETVILNVRSSSEILVIGESA